MVRCLPWRLPSLTLFDQACLPLSRPRFSPRNKSFSAAAVSLETWSSKLAMFWNPVFQSPIANWQEETAEIGDDGVELEEGIRGYCLWRPPAPSNICCDRVLEKNMETTLIQCDYLNKNCCWIILKQGIMRTEIEKKKCVINLLKIIKILCREHHFQKMRHIK